MLRNKQKGAGAPIKNENNDVVSKLPSINEGLWQKLPDKNSPNTMNTTNAENKKIEMHELIDKFTRKKTDLFNNVYNEKGLATNSNQKQVVKGEHYWNDWFGRPGGGAPNPYLQKQNLDDMLEPRKNKFTLSSIENLASYDPSSMATPRKPRSNHHNNYENIQK